MFDLGMKGTKWGLFIISVDLFADKGYSNVSVRDIAKVAGIQAASIYNHFKSKEEILHTAYEYYDYYYNYFIPPLDTLLSYVGTEHPVNTLNRSLFKFDPRIQDTMDKIFLIASMQLYCDTKAQDMIYKNLYILSEKYISALLSRMIEMKLIEPLDINAFALTMTSLCHSAALRMRTQYPIAWDTWLKSVEMLYTQVVEI